MHYLYYFQKINSNREEHTNLFDDILQMNRSPSPDDSGEHDYITGAKEQGHGRGKRPASEPTNIMFKNVKRENSADVVRRQTLPLVKRRGRKRKSVLNVDPAMSPVKCDKLGN